MRWQGVVRTGLRLGRRAILKGRRPGREAVTIVLLVLLATALSLTLTSLLEGVANRPDADRIGSLVIGWTFTIAGVLTLASALQETVGQLVTAPDLPLLRTAPIGASHLLAIKVAAVLPRTLFNVLGVALPAALAWATLHPGTSPFGIALALVTLWAVATGAGVSLALPLLRLVPTTVVTPALHLLSTTGFVVAWLAQALIAPRVVTAALEGRFDAALLAPPPAGSPATIAARLVTEGVRLPDLLACLTWSGASLALALVVANRLLDPLHERATLAPMRRVTVGEPRRGLVRAFLVRDAALVLRDWTITLEALAQFAVWMLLPLAALPLVPLEPTVLARLMMVSLALSLGLDLAARALPLEHAALAWSRLTPVSPVRWILLRAVGVAVAGAIVLLVGWSVVAIALRLPPRAAADVLAFALGAATAAIGLGFALGAWFGDLEWRDPRLMLGHSGRMIGALVLLTLSSGWVLWAHRMGPEPSSLTLAVATVVVGAAIGAIGMALAARGIERQDFTSR